MVRIHRVLVPPVEGMAMDLPLEGLDMQRQELLREQKRPKTQGTSRLTSVGVSALLCRPGLFRIPHPLRILDMWWSQTRHMSLLLPRKSPYQRRSHLGFRPRQPRKLIQSGTSTDQYQLAKKRNSPPNQKQRKQSLSGKISPCGVVTVPSCASVFALVTVPSDCKT